MNREPVIRWDIVEEHLDEAAFLRGQWEEALRSPDYTLAEIAEGPEERLLAHLDGLVLGGARVARKLLLPAMVGDEPGPAFAAAFALLASEDGDFTGEVLAALAKAEPEPRLAIRRALALVPRPDLGQRLVALLPKAAPGLGADLLEVLGYLRVDPGVRLESLAANPETEALAIRLGGVFPDRLDPTALARGLGSGAAEVRAAAMETGLVAGVRGAFAAAEAEVAGRGAAFGTAALLLGLSGDEKSVAALVPALREETLARQAAFALGFTGRVPAADALLEAMKDEKVGPVAAEGFAAIAGLAVEKHFAREPAGWNPDEDEAEEEEPYGPEADLAKPVPETIARWWGEARPKLDPAQRWLRGRPWSPEALLAELDEGPARRRAGLALDLAVRTRGRAQLAWDALSVRQRREMAEARGAMGRAAARSYPEMVRAG